MLYAAIVRPWPWRFFCPTARTGSFGKGNRLTILGLGTREQTRPNDLTRPQRHHAGPARGLRGHAAHYCEEWGNPSSAFKFGSKLRGVIETACAQDASSRCITGSGKGGAWRLHGFRRSRVAGPARFWGFPLPNG